MNPLAAISALWRARGIPLSWLLLTRQPVRLLVALAGISVITLGGAFGMWRYIPKFEIS